MDTPLEITIYDDGKVAYQTNLPTIVEFGRQNSGEQAPYHMHAHPDLTRVIIARLDEVTVPRRLLRVERVGADQARLTNLSKTPLRLDVGPPLDPGSIREVGLPFSVTVGSKALTLGQGTQESQDLHSLPDSSLSRTVDPAATLWLATAAQDKIAEGTLDNETLLRWIHAALGVLQSAAGTNDFFRRAAGALVDLVGLDFGCVLLHEKEGWVVHKEGRAGLVRASARGTTLAAEWQPSQQVLASVLREKRTFWLERDAAPASASLVGVKSVVASPILSAHDEVIGVLYGERRSSGAKVQPITRLVAMLVDILAGGVAVGLGRLEQERIGLLWEQFVTPELSRHLAENPGLLAGRDAEITWLTCDIRGFSRICNNLGAARTFEWVQDVLGTLSDCALAEEGVLVDYVGDALQAMWGAPENQPDHAVRACRAALAMLAAVTTLNGRWKETVREAMSLSIGISSGTARVGNIGSARKFKYGAHGTIVNLASRVDGATRYFKVPMLITEAVRNQLDDTFLTRRLSALEVVNIADPVTVYQLTSPGHEGWATLKEAYEQALAHFENKEFRAAARILGALLAQPSSRDDGPSLVLMQRAVTCLVDEPKQFTPVWKLPDKGK
jgi:adenylate cyclase